MDASFLRGRIIKRLAALRHVNLEKFIDKVKQQLADRNLEMTSLTTSSRSMRGNWTNQTLVKLVAQATPWLAPFPSAYFVARSSMEHLEIPLVVVIIIAVIVEFLGLTSVHTWLWLSDWNTRKRKTDPSAPSAYALILCLVYLVITVGLTTLLEIMPILSTYAPALFPFLAMIGAFNLALISHQENREVQVRQERDEQKMERQTKRSANWSENRSRERSDPVQSNVQNRSTSDDFERSELVLNAVNQAKKFSHVEAVNALTVFYEQNPNASYSLAGRAVHRSKAWVSGEIAKLEQAGQLHRSAIGIEIIRQE